MSAIDPGTAARTAAQSTEFDAFGPWIDAVRSAEGVPRLYRDYPIDFDSARLVLKFPRNISRRDATPAMDLYDHLAIAGETHFTILSRTGSTYSERTFAYAQVAAIVDSVDMLDGRLAVHTVSGDVITVPYSGSSRDRVSALIGAIRAGAAPGVMPGVAPEVAVASQTAGPTVLDRTAIDALGERDAVFAAEARDVLLAEPGMRAVGVQGRHTLRTLPGLVDAVRTLFFPRTLQAAVVLASPTELQVLGRRDRITRSSVPVLSLARTIVPLGLVDSVASAPHPRFSGVTIVTVRSAAASIEIAVAAGSSAERALVALHA